MLGLAALLFFSVTGFTLNHADWSFGIQRREATFQGQMQVRWLAAGQPETAIDRLAIAEFLRASHRITGALEDFRTEDAECTLTFQGPGTSTDVSVRRDTGAYQATVRQEGWIAILNDLHKGRHTGRHWSLLIDASAILLSLVSASGIWLLWYVRRRRVSGLWIGIAGAALVAAVYALGVQ